MNRKKSYTVELDLEATLPEDTLAKLYLLCKKRKLPYPEGIAVICNELITDAVSSPRQKKNKSSSSKQGKVC